jgi:limonene-1,2-epoxide hydrolase
MEDTREVVVRSFMASWKLGVQVSLSYLSQDAIYRVNAWHKPLQGIEAIRLDFERQRSMWTEFSCELLNTAMVGDTVFTERLDTVHTSGKDITIHSVGVFEVNDGGKITNWRDYFDMKEIEAQFTA